ncbi:MAG: T9SS type A sorting domain-containing protein [Paludibacteraceae bacterium]|nr:T9SS type A sorting domain-containing protein [Paludibacteraceae bacterium]MBO7367974.1 T9SS type A sorting domain-containing protein [Paludibacteraceae bacterium]
MRKLLLTTLAVLLTTAGMYAGRMAYTTNIDGKVRSYAIYTPTQLREHVVILLHGMGETYDDYDRSTMQAFADAHRCALILPQALPEQDETLLELLGVASGFQAELGELKEALAKSAWGANVYVTIDDLCTYLEISKSDLELYVNFLYPQFKPYLQAGKIQINKDVNDSKFIEYLRVNNNRDGACDTNIIGCSLGGAMAYKYAFEDPSKVRKLVDASGFVSKGVEIPSNYNIPTFIIHSKTDEIVPYEGGLFNRPIEDFIGELVQTNTHGTPVIRVINPYGSYDDQVDVRDWTDDPEVLVYKPHKASHSLVNDLANIGIDLYGTIGDFLFDEPSAADEATADASALNIYPNPVENIANVSIDGKYEIFNLAGVMVASGDTENGTIDLSSLIAGRYILMLTGSNDVYRSIIIKK